VAQVSITRLRLRKAWYELPFIWHAVRSQMQAQRAEGSLGLVVRRTRGRVYWTMTVWRDAEATRAYMTSSAHLAAMPNLMHWCDEASVARWQADTLPTWEEGERHLAAEGRLSKVLHPSPAHAAGKVLPE